MKARIFAFVQRIFAGLRRRRSHCSVSVAGRAVSLRARFV